MTSTATPAFVPGVWGPYYSAMVPGLWLNEGGQSAAGAAIDRLIEMHPASGQLKVQAKIAGLSLPVYLADLASYTVSAHSAAVHLADGLHVVPEFSGNRAPFADPAARAVICGLSMDNDVNSLVSLYIAGICSLGYGLRQIVEAQSGQGVVTHSIVISGGAGQHPLVRQLLADACGLPVFATQSPEPVLLGSAILAAVAGGVFDDMRSAMSNMTVRENEYFPVPECAEIHYQRYAAFKTLQDAARKTRV